MEPMGFSSDPPKPGMNRIWVKDALAPSEVRDFCMAVFKSIPDAGIRMKLFLDGPKETFNWIIAILSNSALVCALIFASVFGSLFNTDLYQRAFSTETTSQQYLAQTSYFLLFLAILISAFGMGLSTLLLNVMPQMVRRNSADFILFLSHYCIIVFITAFISPTIAVALAIGCMVIYIFLVFGTSFAIVTACVAFVLTILFVISFAVLVRLLVVRAQTFEKLIKENKIDEAFQSVNDFKLPDTERVVAKIRHIGWSDQD